MRTYNRLLRAQLWDGDPTTEPDFDVDEALEGYYESQDINNDEDE